MSNLRKILFVFLQLVALYLLLSIYMVFNESYDIINDSGLNNLHVVVQNNNINSNLSSLNSGVNNLYDVEGKWTIGLVQTTNTYANNDDTFIFDIFNDKSLKYHHYQIYSCNDIMNKNKSLNITFIADPFLHIINDNDNTVKWYLFYELKNVLSGKGEIGVSLSNDNGNSWQFLGIILVEKFHLSYPNIITIPNDNNIYMIPETNEDESVRIYMSTKKDFPFNWRLNRKKLVSLNTKWADTCVVFHKRRYYIFTTNTIQESLHIFYTDLNSTFIQSNWHSHVMNPLYAKISAYFRSAGNPYYNKNTGKLYRFTQESNDFYGVKVHIFVITKLKTDEYKETFINTIEPSTLGTNIKRIHHLNVHHLKMGGNKDMVNIVFDFDTTMGPDIDINYLKKNNDIDIAIANKNYKTQNKDVFNKLNMNVNDINFIYKLPKLIHFIWISDNINNNNEIDETKQWLKKINDSLNDEKSAILYTGKLKHCYSLACLLSDNGAIVYIEKSRNISDRNENLISMNNTDDDCIPLQSDLIWNYYFMNGIMKGLISSETWFNEINKCFNEISLDFIDLFEEINIKKETNNDAISWMNNNWCNNLVNDFVSNKHIYNDKKLKLLLGILVCLNNNYYGENNNIYKFLTRSNDNHNLFIGCRVRVTQLNKLQYEGLITSINTKSREITILLDDFYLKKRNDNINSKLKPFEIIRLGEHHEIEIIDFISDKNYIKNHTKIISLISNNIIQNWPDLLEKLQIVLKTWTKMNAMLSANQQKSIQLLKEDNNNNNMPKTPTETKNIQPPSPLQQPQKPIQENKIDDNNNDNNNEQEQEEQEQEEELPKELPKQAIESEPFLMDDA
eukprot:270131_1